MTERRSPSQGFYYVAAAVWLALTVSLASWWLAIGLSIGDMHRMFAWEGAAFIALLVAGGGAILLGIRREYLRRASLETFFLSFTHDLKTSLASLQLRAEGLREDWPAPPSRDALDQLLHDAVRLQIQLENSLFVAQPDGRLLAERVDVAREVERLAIDWPELAVRVTGNAEMLADVRAFDAVIRNLLQNAVVHGGARSVEVQIASPANGHVQVTVVDDGRGVSREIFATLGQPFARPGSTSGTGMGLFVCGQLVTRMNGSLRFTASAPSHGLTVILDLPGAA